MSKSLVFQAMTLLKPYDVDFKKMWIGNERDGGYVLLDVPDHVGCDVVSFGVGADSSFELEMARRGSRVFIYDHTVSGPVGAHSNFYFKREGICGDNERAPHLKTLSEHAAEIPGLKDGAILKMDVEGAEWDTFATAPKEVISAFDQIVLEVHWLQHLFHPPFAYPVIAALAALNESHTLYHVHSNNFCKMHIVDDMPVPSVLELSYVKTAAVRRRASKTVYPHVINKSNHAEASDHPLLFYPFLPQPDGLESEILDMVERI